MTRQITHLAVLGHATNSVTISKHSFMTSNHPHLFQEVDDIQAPVQAESSGHP